MKLKFVGFIVWFLILGVVGVSSVRAAELNSPPYEVVDHGMLYYLGGNAKQYLITLNNGERHILMYYRASYGPGGYDAPIQILDINTETGEHFLVDTPLTTSSGNASATVYYPGNNKIYIPSADDAHLVEYDPATHEVVYVSSIADKRPQTVVIGDDGVIYIGTGIYGKAFSYDPRTGEFRDWGIMDDPGGDYYRYVYTIGADERYIYCGMAQQPWYLVVFDRETGEEAVYFKNEISTGYVQHAKAGGWYYRTNTDGFRRYYRLESGVPVEITASEWPDNYDGYVEIPNVIQDARNFHDFGIDIDLTDADVDSFNPIAKIKWKKVEEVDWNTTEVEGLNMGADVMFRLFADPNSVNEAIISTRNYGKYFRYNFESRQATELGEPTISTYNGVYAFNFWFFTGYPTISIRYDPNLPWTLTDSTIDKTTSNPKFIGGFGKYQYYIVDASDGLVYVAAQHERDSTGVELAWHDPVTDEKGSIFYDENLVLRGLTTSRDKQKLYLNAKTKDTEQDKLLIFDAASQTLEKEIMPLPVDTEKFVEVEPNILVGITEWHFFKMNTQTEEILYMTDLGGQMKPTTSRSNQLIEGPDGYVWSIVEYEIVRINPDDGIVEKVVSLPGLIYNEKQIKFVGNSLTVVGDFNLYEIKGLFEEGGPSLIPGDANEDGKVDGVDYVIWLNHYDEVVENGHREGDFNNDGKVDGVDYVIWLNHYS